MGTDAQGVQKGRRPEAFGGDIDEADAPGAQTGQNGALLVGGLQDW